MPRQTIKLFSLSLYPLGSQYLYSFRSHLKYLESHVTRGAGLELPVTARPWIRFRHLNHDARFSAPPAAGFFRLIRIKKESGPRTASAEGVGKARARPDANWASSRRCHLATSSVECGQGRRVRGTTVETNLPACDYFCGSHCQFCGPDHRIIFGFILWTRPQGGVAL